MAVQPGPPTYEQLVASVVTLTAEVERLRERVAELEGRPPAAPPGPPPFVKPPPPRRGKKRRPGRGPGHAPALRAMPERVDETVDVPLPAGAGAGAGGGGGQCLCPECSGALEDLKAHERLVEDLVPASVKVTRYRTASGYCKHCRRRVESRHAEQPPAADVPHAQMGLNALAAAAVLKQDAGLPYRKVARVLEDLCGLRVSAGALPKQVRRLGGWLAEPYGQIRGALRASPVVHCDETGARVDGKPHWLWVLTSPSHTLFHLDQSRAGRVPAGLLGDEFVGRLVTDFFSAYNTLSYRQQKCNTHLLREVVQTAARNPAFAASPFATRLKRLVKDMLALKKRWDQFDDATYDRRADRLHARLEALGRTGATSADEDVRRLAKRVAKHAFQITAFLWEQEVPGENNAAERAIRPAVVIRKISGGHRGRSTADASAVITSVLRTARQQGRHLIDTVKHLVKAHLSGGPTDLLTAAPAG